MLSAGARLCGGGTRITNVSLAGRAADIIDDDCNLIQARANDLGAQITGDVVLTSDTGASVTEVNGFEYVGKGNITSVSPSAGQGGSTLVTIQGSSLFGGGTKAVAVTLGGVAATVQPESNDTYIVATVPMRARKTSRRRRVMW